jgi:hypothetical protein
MKKMTRQIHLVVEPEAKLYSHLPVIDLVILYIASSFDDLKPVDIVQCLAGLCYCILYGVFNARFGGAGQLNLFVNVLAHITPRNGSFAVPKAIKVPALKYRLVNGFFRVVSQRCHSEDAERHVKPSVIVNFELWPVMRRQGACLG